MRLEIQVPEPSILMQISSDPISLTPFSWWKLKIANEGQGEAAGLAGRRRNYLGRRGTCHFITPLIPNTSGMHTGHVRYLRAGCSFSKFHSLNSNPLLYHFLIQKHVCPWSKQGVNTFLIQMPDVSGICGLAVLFPNFIHLIPIAFSIISWSKNMYVLDPNKV